MLKDDRMKLIYASVRTGVKVYDVGTDHGILPIELILKGKAPECVMTDISSPSLEKGVANARKSGVGAKIEAYCTNGTLNVPMTYPSDIIIAGMGGELIAQIIDQDKRLKNRELRFVLQPMSKPEELRAYLAENGFEIESEVRAEAAGRIYSVICTHYTSAKQSLTEKERFLGYGFDESLELDRKYAEKLLRSIRVRINGINHAEQKNNEIISELESLINAEKIITDLLN